MKSLNNPRETSDSIVATVIPHAISLVRRNFVTFNGMFPSYGDNDISYNLTENKNWLAAFWTGLLWLISSETKDAQDVANARSLLPTFVNRLDQNIRLNHDIGFLFILSARAQWQLTDDESAYKLALRGAEALASRYLETGQYIQAWGDIDDKDEGGRFIIDCMMNLPLLLWAHRETGNVRYRDIAIAHAKTTQKYLIRDDFSTYHTYFLDQKQASPSDPKHIKVTPMIHYGRVDKLGRFMGLRWSPSGQMTQSSSRSPRQQRIVI